MMLLDRLLERRYCLTNERCPRFNRKENALEPWIIFILVITFSLESDEDFSGDRHKLSQHVGILCVMNFAILKSETRPYFSARSDFETPLNN